MVFKARYGIEVVGIDRDLVASFIYKILYYEAYEYVKNLNAKAELECSTC